MKTRINKMYWELKMSVSDIAKTLEIDPWKVVDAIERLKWEM